MYPFNFFLREIHLEYLVKMIIFLQRNHKYTERLMQMILNFDDFRLQNFEIFKI